MQLLIIRHAIAMDRDEFARTGRNDNDRPLTPSGKRRMRRNAQGLRRAATHIAILATSPLVRAHQTAEIVRDQYRLGRAEIVEALKPNEHPRGLLTWLGRHKSNATVAVVGHDPHVGKLATWCIAGVAEPVVEFKKGGAALIEFDRKPAAGQGRLLWLLTPGQLRALAEAGGA